jgi:DNA-binding LacI/PurR family transcriptional regulator
MTVAKRRSITIRDVARLAGVSVSSVSVVLNQKGTASAGVRQRVEEAIAALDYYPDIAARSLKTGQSKAIGMVVPDVTNPYYTEVMSGLEALATSRGYSVILSNSGEDPMRERENLRMLYTHRVAGVVLACSDGYAMYDRLVNRRFPIVFVDRLPVADFDGRAVIVDNVGAAHAATNHLIELGHEKIAIIAGRMNVSTGIGRAEGLRRAMSEANLLIPEGYFQQGDFRLESGYRCGIELMRLPEPPTAILACNNEMTLGLMRALAECRVPCPESVSVVGFDDFPWMGDFRPQMTVVAQPTYEIGRQAMRMLLAVIEPGSEEASEMTDSVVILKAELRVRQSTMRPIAPKTVSGLNRKSP